jgi:methyltransferase OMS1
MALLYFHAEGDVLEVGAGTGRNLGYYPGQSTVGKIVLSDSSDKMLLRAKEKVARMSDAEKGRYQLLVADAAKLNHFPDNSFDTVVDTFGLCSFDDPIAVLKELQRVCKPNGKILLLEHGRSKSFA